MLENVIDRTSNAASFLAFYRTGDDTLVPVNDVLKPNGAQIDEPLSLEVYITNVKDDFISISGLQMLVTQPGSTVDAVYMNIPGVGTNEVMP